MAYDPRIELVVDKSTGVLTRCYVLDANTGERLAELPITEARELYDPSGLGIVSINIHAFRVKRTEANAV